MSAGAPAAFWLQRRRFGRVLLGFGCVALAALLLGAAVAGAALALLQSGGLSPLRLAVAAGDDEVDLEALATGVLGAGQLDYLVLSFTQNENEARRQVAAGEASAALLLPAGFAQSLMSGENLSPTLLLPEGRPLENLLVASLADSAVRMLAAAQRGITAGAAAASGLPGGENAAYALNLKYGLWVLGRDGVIEKTVLQPTGSLGTAPHYLLCFLVFLYFLCAPMLYDAFSEAKNRVWRGRLRGAGFALPLYNAALLLWGFLGYLALLLATLLPAGAAAGARAGLSPALLGGAALCALFFSAFSFLCCQLGPQPVCVGAAALLGTGGLFVGGGVLPPAMLPPAVGALARFSPFSWAAGVLSPAFGAKASGGAALALGLLCALLVALCLFWGVGALPLARRRREAHRV